LVTEEVNDTAEPEHTGFSDGKIVIPTVFEGFTMIVIVFELTDAGVEHTSDDCRVHEI
jgi:hypothetical protein